MTEFAPSLKLLSHPERIVRFVRREWTAPPIMVEISATNSCNARCPWCFYVSSDYKQRHSAEELAPALLRSALEDMATMGVEAVTWTGGGEPTVYSAVDEMIDLAHHLGLRQGLFTNAYRRLRSPEKLDWIRVTITERFVITKIVAEYAKSTKVGVNFNLCSQNEGQLRSMVEQARSAGVHYFQVRPALADRADLQRPVVCPEWLREFETETFRIVLTPYKFDDYLHPHGYPLCHGHRFVPFVWHNGDVAVCAYHFGKPEFVFGNLLQQQFGEIWCGERRRQMIADGVAVLPTCQHCCKNHEINKTLAALAGNVAGPDDLHFV